MKKILAILLIICLSFSTMATLLAFAEDDDINFFDDFNDFSKIFEKSKGLQISKSQGNNIKYNDPTNLARFSATDEWITYAVYKAKQIEVAANFANQSKVEHFKFYISSDGVGWDEVKPDVTDDKSATGVWGSWLKFVYRFNQLPQDTKYFKIQFMLRNSVGWENQLQSLKMVMKEYQATSTTQTIDQCTNLSQLYEKSDGIMNSRIDKDKDTLKDDSFLLKAGQQAEHLVYKLPDAYIGLLLTTYIQNGEVSPKLSVSADNKSYVELFSKPKVETLSNGWNKITYFIGDKIETTKFFRIDLAQSNGDGWGVRIGEFKIYLDTDDEYMKLTIPTKVNSVSFSDIKNHWAENTINELASRNIINGYDGFVFKPQSNISVAEMIKLLCVAKGIQLGNSLDDYTNYGIDNNIITANEFDSFSRAITRREIITLISKMFRFKTDYTLEKVQLSDLELLTENEKNSLLPIYFNGIMSGDESRNLQPNSLLLRCEAATIIARIIMPEYRARVKGLYEIAICSSEKFNKVAENISKTLQDKGYSKVSLITSNDLKSKTVLKGYDCLILAEAFDVTKEGKEALKDYLSSGGDIVLLGDTGRKLYLGDYNLPVFEDYEIYRYSNAVSIENFEGQDIVNIDKISGDFSGLSANGYTLIGLSSYQPVLNVKDKFGRTVGFGAGIMSFYDGQYKDGKWLAYGIENTDFYMTDGFSNSFIQSMQYISKGNSVEVARENNQKRLDYLNSFNLETQGSDDFVRLSEDKTNFIYPNGEKMFMIGANYAAPVGFGYGYSKNPDIQAIEEDFKIASEYGINSLRMWSLEGENELRDNMIKYLSRKYNIYMELVLPTPVAYKTDEEYKKVLVDFVSRWKDEKMVVGYDLKNEPYLEDIAGMNYNGSVSPIIALDAPVRYSSQVNADNLAKQVKNNDYPSFNSRSTWLTTEDKMKIKAASNLFINPTTAQYTRTKKFYSTYPDYTGVFEPSSPEMQDLFDAVDATYKLWINAAIDAIKSVDTKHYITVGYNEIFALLPANDVLDYQNVHVYQPPANLDSFKQNVTTLDRLRIRFKNQPITFGEFGYSAGKEMRPGEVMDVNTEAVGEFAHFLYPYHKGYSGSMIWMLNELGVPYIFHNLTWYTSKAPASSRYGMFAIAADGTQKLAPKPLAYAVKFFSEYAKKYEAGRGTFRFIENNTRMESGYEFKDTNALFVGACEYSSDVLSFHSKDAVNVMLIWENNELKIMATADVKISVKIKKFVSGNKVNGVYDTYKIDGDTLDISLLKGEVVTISD